jgi:hypothetical protein
MSITLRLTKTAQLDTVHEGEESCPRCHGAVAPESFIEASGSMTKLEGWRCLNCGARGDWEQGRPTLWNRATSVSPRRTLPTR